MSVLDLFSPDFNYKLVQNDYITSTEFKCLFRANINTADEFRFWLKDFEERTSTTWNLRQSKVNGRNFAFSRDFVCHHSSFRKRKAGGKDKKCDASLRVRIKHDNRYSRCRDAFLKEGLKAIVKIDFKHSHRTDVAEAWKWLRRTSETKSQFINYFNDETYDEARKNLIEAEEMSSLDSEPEESSKRKKRPPKRFISEEESDDDMPKIKITGVSSYSSLDSFNNIPENLNIESSQPLASTSFNHTPAPVHSTTPNISEVDFNRIASMLGQLQKTVSNLVNEVRELKEEVRAGRLNASIKEEEDDIFSSQMDLTGKLPLQTLDEFIDNEESLKDPEFRNLFVKILVSSGGRNSRHFTYNVLKRVMSNRLANNFSFTGKPAKDKGKERKLPFCSTLMYKSIQDAARKMFPGTTEDALKQNVSLWLQQAKHRMSKRDSTNNAEPNETEWILS